MNIELLIRHLYENLVNNDFDEEILCKDIEDIIDYFLIKLDCSGIPRNSDSFNQFLNDISSLNNNLLDSQDLLSRLNWLEQMELNDTNISLKANHTLVMNIFDAFNKFMDECNIEHYYTSGILSYILINKELERYHHDLDVFVNEKDLIKLEQECCKYGFVFKRIFGDRNDGTKRRILKVYYKNYDLPITIFMYVRNRDNSIVQNDYFYDNGELYVDHIYNSSDCVSLSFDESIHYHNGIPYKAITIEALYNCKNKARKKDIYDCMIMKPYVDFEKEEKLSFALEKNFVYTEKVVGKMENFINNNENKKR